MLYSIEGGVNASPRSSQYDREADFLTRGDALSLNGLAATVPHRANVYATPTGGGGYTPQEGGGGGGSVPEGSVAVGITQISPYRPVGRNTSPFTPGVQTSKAPARVKFQPSSQGARISRGERISPLSASGAGYPAGGLFGLGEVDGFFNDAGRWFKRRFKKRRRAARPDPYYKPDPAPGIAGLDGFFKKVSKWQPIPKSVRRVIPKPIRKVVKYTGAVTQTALAPVLTTSQQKRIFGLGARDSKLFSKGQQISRIAIATIATAGGTKYLMGAKTASGATALTPQGFTPGYASAGKLSLGYNAAPVSLTGGAPFATAGQVGAASSVAAPSLSLASPTTGGVLSTLGKAGLTTLNTITQGLAPLVAVKLMSGGGGEAPIQEGGYYESGGSTVMLPESASPGAGGFGGQAGPGDSGSGVESSEAPILAEMSLPAKIVLGGVAVTAGVFLYKRLA